MELTFIVNDGSKGLNMESDQKLITGEEEGDILDRNDFGTIDQL